MRYIYELLKQRLIQITALKDVSWYTGQYAQNGGQSLFVDAAAYIEFMPISWQTKGKNVQEAVLEFDIHTMSEAITEDDERVLNIDIAHLDLVQQVYAKLQNYQASLSDLPAFAAMANPPQVINSIVRVGTTPDHNFTNLLVTVQKFQCTVQDLTVIPQGTPTQAALQANVIIQ